MVGYIEEDLFTLLDTVNDAIEDCKMDMKLAEVQGVYPPEDYEKALSMLREMRRHIAAIENLYNSLPDIF